MQRRDFLKTAGAGSLALGAGLTAGRAGAARAEYKWKMVTTWPKNFPGLGTGANLLADFITRGSEGRLTVTVHGAGEIVPAFESLFGEASFSAELDLDAIESSLDERIETAREKVGSVRRIQVVRDLSVIARADGRVSSEEQAVIERIAQALDVPHRIVQERFCSTCELHD